MSIGSRIRRTIKKIEGKGIVGKLIGGAIKSGTQPIRFVSSIARGESLSQTIREHGREQFVGVRAREIGAAAAIAYGGYAAYSAYGASATAGGASTLSASAGGTAVGGGSAVVSSATPGVVFAETAGGYGTVTAASGGGAAIVGGATATGTGITASNVLLGSTLLTQGLNLLKRIGINVLGEERPDQMAPSPMDGAGNFGAIYPNFLEPGGAAIGGFGAASPGDQASVTLTDLLTGSSGIWIYIVAALLAFGAFFLWRRS